MTCRRERVYCEFIHGIARLVRHRLDLHAIAARAGLAVLTELVECVYRSRRHIPSLPDMNSVNSRLYCDDIKFTK